MYYVYVYVYENYQYCRCIFGALRSRCGRGTPDPEKVLVISLFRMLTSCEVDRAETRFKERLVLRCHVVGQASKGKNGLVSLLPPPLIILHHPFFFFFFFCLLLLLLPPFLLHIRVYSLPPPPPAFTSSSSSFSLSCTSSSFSSPLSSP